MRINIKQSFLIAALVSFVSVSAAQTGPTDVEMVKLSGGSFLMGSESGYAFERPVHRVAIKPFAIGKYEVLGFQYRAFETATGRSGAKYHGDKAPVTDVSWHDAQAYIAWLNGRTGLSYRLPTESEWEYAARAGSRTAYHFGDDKNLLPFYANYYVERSIRPTVFSPIRFRHRHRPRPHPPRPIPRRSPPHVHPPYHPTTAGSFLPNAWGLYDMLGNVQEWVEDCWHGDYSGAPSDGRAWVSGCVMRDDGVDFAVARGGTWINDAWYLRSALRGWDFRTYRDLNFGFRLVQDL